VIGVDKLHAADIYGDGAMIGVISSGI